MDELYGHIYLPLTDYLRVVNNKLVFISAIIYDNYGPLNILVHKSVQHKHKKMLALPLKWNTQPSYSHLCKGARTIYYISEEETTNEMLTDHILPYTTNVTKSLLDLDETDLRMIRCAIDQDYMNIFTSPIKITIDIKYDFHTGNLYVLENAASSYLNNEEYDDIPDMLKSMGFKRFEDEKNDNN